MRNYFAPIKRIAVGVGLVAALLIGCVFEASPANAQAFSIGVGGRGWGATYSSPGYYYGPYYGGYAYPYSYPYYGGYYGWHHHWRHGWRR